MERFFDVLVAGGGAAGSAAAIALCRRGFSLALIEPDSYRSRRIGETLPPAIRRPLNELDVWHLFQETSPLESYGIRSAWETAEARERESLRNPYGCGWHVDRACFDAMLARAAAGAGANVVTARVASCDKTPEGSWQLEAVQKGATVRLNGRFLIDATGRKALLANLLGAQAQVADRLIGAISFAHAPEPLQWTVLEAVENGWWYSAPLPGNGIVFSYMTDADLWQATNWRTLLDSAPLTAERAGCVVLPPPSEIVSASSVVRSPVIGQDWIAIGDAAFAYDPLSGQGVYKSIDSGLRAAAAIERSFVGDTRGLWAYEKWVQETYASYRAIRAGFYSSVQRWPNSVFWARRAEI